jgi:hypothetical protein
VEVLKIGIFELNDFILLLKELNEASYCIEIPKSCILA